MKNMMSILRLTQLTEIMMSKYKFNCSYCPASKVLTIKNNDFQDRMCTECGRSLKIVKKA